MAASMFCEENEAFLFAKKMQWYEDGKLSGNQDAEEDSVDLEKCGTGWSGLR